MPNAGDASAILERYLPRLLLGRLDEAPARRSGALVPRVPMAALWLDISGFTPLTRRYAREGTRGAERVSELLDDVFGTLIERIHEAGGDLVDLAGDGLLAVWPADDREALPRAVLAATRCALEIQRDMDRLPVDDDTQLRFYAGLGAGRLSLLEVGGVRDQWRFVVAGDPLGQMARAKEAGEAGAVVLSGEAYALVEASVDAVPAPGGCARIHGLRGGGGAAASPWRPGARTAHGSGTDREALLRSYVVDSVLDRVDAGQTDWLGEFRLATVSFVVLPDPDAATGAGRRLLVDAVRAGQEAIHVREGSLNQVIVDDNGLVLLSAWGVPGHQHEDDARRAVEATEAMRAALEEMGLTPRCGLATGRVFCGSIGSPDRQRYALVGATVNRAARIAMAAPGVVRCDLPTRVGAAAGLSFVEADPLALKGIEEPVRCFEPTGPAEGAVEAADPDGSRPRPALSGRARERALVEATLAAEEPGDRATLLLVEGEAGIGKSVLLDHLAAEAEAMGLVPLRGRADSVERGTAFHPWRPVFRRLVGLDPEQTSEERRMRLLARLAPLAPDDEKRAWIPLLEPVFRVGLEDNETTAAMTGAGRGAAARELLVHLFDALAGPRPVVVLDDLHWFDSASLELLEELRRRVPRALVAAATRPPAGEPPSALTRLAEDTGTVRIPLVEMEGAELLDVVARSLGVDEVPPALADFLVARGEGHPLFTAELALLLRELGVVVVEGRRCTFDPDHPGLAAMQVSGRAHGVIASRIDRLDARPQLALKVASVLGRTFEFRRLHLIHPIEEDRSRLRSILDELTRPRLLEQEPGGRELSYLFRHVLIREVAYDLVAFAQRRRLHESAARALEADPDGRTEHGLLAHHWLQAEAYDPAVAYAEAAGDEAMRRGAGREAYGWFAEALRVCEEHPGAIEDTSAARSADLERRMGEALEQLPDVPAASARLEGALARLGEPTWGPEEDRRGDLLRESLVQLGHVLRPAWLPRRSDPERARVLEIASRAYGTLAEHRYFESDLLGMVLYSVRAVNLAEQAGRPEAAERAYVTLAHSAGLARLGPLVRRYRARSSDPRLGRNRAFRDIELGGRLLGRGETEEAARLGRRAAEVARRHADRHGEATAWGLVVSSMLRLGRTDEAAAVAERLFETGHDDWGHAARFSAWVFSGRPPDALERYASIERWEPAFALAHLTARALHAEALGDRRLALERADLALAHVEGPGLRNATTSGHYAALLSLYTRLWRSGTDDAQRDALVGRIDRLRRELATYGRMWPIGRPRTDRAAGIVALHRGQRRRAAKLLTRGLRTAERLTMRPEAILLRLELGHSGLPGAEAHLVEALRQSEQLRLDRLAAEARAALGGGAPPSRAGP